MQRDRLARDELGLEHQARRQDGKGLLGDSAIGLQAIETDGRGEPRERGVCQISAELQLVNAVIGLIVTLHFVVHPVQLENQILTVSPELLPALALLSEVGQAELVLRE